MRHTNLASTLRSAGLEVIEVAGWKARGGEMSSVESLIAHHTATNAAAPGNYPTLNLVKNGRSDLPGPLAQLGLGRDGTWYVIASGRANHAGVTSKSWQTNDHALGVEAEAEGTGDPRDWPKAQMDSYARGMAALAKAFGLPVSRVLGHKEIAAGYQGGPVNGRKVDPSFNMDTFRAAVARGPEKEEPDMDKAQDARLKAIEDATTPKVKDGDRWLEPHDAERVQIELLRRIEEDNAARAAAERTRDAEQRAQIAGLTAAVTELAKAQSLPVEATLEAIREAIAGITITVATQES